MAHTWSSLGFRHRGRKLRIRSRKDRCRRLSYLDGFDVGAVAVVFLMAARLFVVAALVAVVDVVAVVVVVLAAGKGYFAAGSEHFVVVVDATVVVGLMVKCHLKIHLVI